MFFDLTAFFFFNQILPHKIVYTETLSKFGSQFAKNLKKTDYKDRAVNRKGCIQGL